MQRQSQQCKSRGQNHMATRSHHIRVPTRIKLRTTTLRMFRLEGTRAIRTMAARRSSPIGLLSNNMIVHKVRPRLEDQSSHLIAAAAVGVHKPMTSPAMPLRTFTITSRISSIHATLQPSQMRNEPSDVDERISLRKSQRERTAGQNGPQNHHVVLLKRHQLGEVRLVDEERVRWGHHAQLNRPT